MSGGRGGAVAAAPDGTLLGFGAVFLAFAIASYTRSRTPNPNVPPDLAGFFASPADPFRAELVRGGRVAVEPEADVGVVRPA